VSVDLLRDTEGVSLIVQDDGRGLPSGAANARLSHGIVGMRQRVRALKGEFRINGRPGAGTTIEVIIPLTAAEAAPEIEPAPTVRVRSAAGSPAD
jgi:signal transduction histidine kinase